MSRRRTIERARADASSPDVVVFDDELIEAWDTKADSGVRFESAKIEKMKYVGEYVSSFPDYPGTVERFTRWNVGKQLYEIIEGRIVALLQRPKRVEAPIGADPIQDSLKRYGGWVRALGRIARLG